MSILPHNLFYRVWYEKKINLNAFVNHTQNIYYIVINWLFLYLPCHILDGTCIGLILLCLMFKQLSDNLAHDQYRKQDNCIICGFSAMHPAFKSKTSKYSLHYKNPPQDSINISKNNMLSLWNSNNVAHLSRRNNHFFVSCHVFVAEYNVSVICKERSRL
jgi:hypothetical protein